MILEGCILSTGRVVVYILVIRNVVLIVVLGNVILAQELHNCTVIP